MASTLLSSLPPTEGLLPKWLLFVSLISVCNTVQSYSTLQFTARFYNPTAIDPPPQIPKQVTGLSSRTWGTWTLLTSLVRLYAAYNITNGAFYQLTMCTYGVAWLHFMAEWLIYGTTRWGKPLAAPILIANGSLIWMYLQYGYYVEA